MKPAKQLFIAALLSSLGIGVQAGPNIAELNIGMRADNITKVYPNAEIRSGKLHDGGDLGFMAYVLPVGDAWLRYQSRPDGVIYHISYEQTFPAAQSEEIKQQVCGKYIAPKPCPWSVRYEETTPDYLATLLSQSSRDDRSQWKVELKKNGRNPENVDLKIESKLLGSERIVKVWRERARVREAREQTQTMLNNSKISPKSKPLF